MKCIVCEFKGRNEIDITKHYEEVHLSTIEPEVEDVVIILEACKNGPKCRYLKEKRCNFTHEETTDKQWKQVQPKRPRQVRLQTQKSKQQPSQENRWPRLQLRKESSDMVQPRHLPRESLQLRREPTQLRREPTQQCRNGNSCIYNKHNKCNFLHVNPRQERLERHGEKQHGPSDPLRPCKFGSKCDMGVRCGFLHLPSDFLTYQGGRRN